MGNTPNYQNKNCRNSLILYHNAIIMEQLKSTLIFLFTFAIALITVSCHEKSKDEKKEIKPEVVIVHNTDQPQFPMSNPAIIFGTDFGSFFKALYKQGRFDEMIKYTSHQVIEKYGRENVLKSYRKMDFGYDIRLRSTTVNPDSSITLNYESYKIATKGILRIHVNIEGDTVRLVTGDLSKGNIFNE